MLLHAIKTVALLLAVSMPANASDAPAQAPHSSPSDQSDPRVERFRRQLESDRERLKIPGLSVVILEDGEVLWTEGFGYADLERKIPATPDTLYHVASLTKTFAAILTLQLVEQKKLDLEAQVAQWVPEIEDERIRVKHLLSHTSEGTPGERFRYNPGFFEHLKVILEKTTEKPLRQLYVETFLGPLAMRDSVPGPDVADDAETWAVLGAANLERYRQVLAGLARPYTYYGDGETVDAVYPPRDFWASAGLLSTVRDMAKYDAAVDCHAFLGEELQARAWTPFLSSAGEPLAHGLGWYVSDYRGTRLVWHFGHWGTGFSAIYVKVPARRLTLIMLTNSEALSDHHFQVGEDITHNVFACSFLNAFVPEVSRAASGEAGEGGDSKPLDAKSLGPGFVGPSPDCECTSRIALEKWIESRRAKARTSIPIAPELAEAYAGSYRLSDRTITVTREENRLFVDVPEGYRSELFAETPAQFFLKTRSWTGTFVSQGGRVVRIDVIDDGRSDWGRRIQ